jgi:hypothetical protein
MRADRRPKTIQRRRCGIALLLVMAAVGLAAALGYAMLAGAALQNMAAANQLKLVSADYIAESGVNTAVYYLSHPPTGTAVDGFWSGTSGSVTLPNGQAADYSVSVSRVGAPWSTTYDIISTASVGSESPVQRQSGARVYVKVEYPVKEAAVQVNNNVTFLQNTTITGDVYVSKNLALRNIALPYPTINGKGFCKTQTTGIGYGTPTGGFKALPSDEQATPTNNDINLYKKYVTGGVEYTTPEIPKPVADLTGTAGVATKGPTVGTNPDGVFFYDAKTNGTLVLGNDFSVQGTLVVDGDVQIKGRGISITPKEGYPALIVTGTLEIAHPSNGLTTNGTTYVGTALKQSGTLGSLVNASTFTVNGALMLGNTTSTAIPTGFNVKTAINYQAAKAKAPGLSPKLATRTVNVQRWGL